MMDITRLTECPMLLHHDAVVIVTPGGAPSRQCRGQGRDTIKVPAAARAVAMQPVRERAARQQLAQQPAALRRLQARACAPQQEESVTVHFTKSYSPLTDSDTSKHAVSY
jgi:hypothetical protein